MYLFIKNQHYDGSRYLNIIVQRNELIKPVTILSILIDFIKI
jgi:hypothetical protein